MSFKSLFFLLVFSSMIMTAILVKNGQDIDLLRIETERDAQVRNSSIQVQLMIDQVCGGRGGSFTNTTLKCD